MSRATRCERVLSADVELLAAMGERAIAHLAGADRMSPHYQKSPLHTKNQTLVMSNACYHMRWMAVLAGRYTANIACKIPRTSTSVSSGKTPKRLINLSLSTALS